MAEKIGKALLLVIGILMIMIFPLPPTLMDLLLASSITLGLIILLAGLYAMRPLDFSVFPTLLLLATLYRLSLNVATTVSTASSPTFWAMRGRPAANKLAVYEPGGRLDFRS